MTSLGRLDGLVGDLREGRTGSLSISTFPSAGQHWVPGVARVLAAEFPDLSMGSYPFIQNGAYGTNLVIRGTDPGRLAEAMVKLTRLFA